MFWNSTPMPSPSLECTTVALHWKNSASVRILTRITAPLENGSGIERHAPKMLKSVTLAGRTSEESIASAVDAKGYLGARRSGRIVRLFVAIGDQFYGWDGNGAGEETDLAWDSNQGFYMWAGLDSGEI